MITAKELRIGNTVSFDGEIYTVNGIRQPMADDPYDVELKTKEGMFISDVPIEDLEGVQISEKLVLKLGFEEIDTFAIDGIEDHHYALFKNGISFELGRPFELVDIGVIEELEPYEVKYLHRLQNIYFELINEELTIKD